MAGVFVLKMVVLLQLKDHPLLSPEAGLDTTAYVRLAEQVVAGNLSLGPGLYYVSPLYIYFLAALLAIFHSFTAVRVAQIALGTASVGFIFLTTRRWVGVRAAWIAAVLAALTGVFTFYEVLILQSSVDACFTAAGLWCLARGVSGPGDLRPKGRSYQQTLAAEGRSYRQTPAAEGRSDRQTPAAEGRSDRLTLAAEGRSDRQTPAAEGRSDRLILAAGFLWGVQTLNRPNVLIAVMGVALVMTIARRRVTPAAWLVAGMLAGIAPVTIRNVVVSGQWTAVSSHGGLNFYIGNNADATGFYHPVPGVRPAIVGQEQDTRRIAEQALGAPLSDAEVNRYFTELALRWMRDHPLDAAALFAKKFAFAFHASHIPLPQSYAFFAYDTPGLLRFLFVGPWLLVPLGLLGAALLLTGAGRRAQRAEDAGRTTAFLIWFSFVPAYAAAVALFFVADRYRLPLMVPLCVTAGGAIDWATAAIAARRMREVASAGAAFAALFAAVNAPVRLDDGRWMEGLRTAERYVIDGRYADADTWAAWLEANGPAQPGAGLLGVAQQMMALNQYDRALPYLVRAHDANPGEPRADYALGQALLKTGRASDAIPHLRHGFEGNVDLPEGGFDYPRALVDSGDPAGAAAAIRRIRPADTANAEAWLRLGRLAMEARAPDVAEPFFRRAAGMQSGDAATRQQYGLDLLVLNRFEDAVRELADAARLDPRDPDTLSRLAYAEAKLGRAADARRHALAALALNPNDPLAQQLAAALR